MPAIQNKMRVLQIAKYYYPFVGGTEQVERDISTVLHNANIEQKIICFNENASDGKIQCNCKETVHDIVDGVEVIRCGYFTKIASQALSLTYAKELKKIMDEFRPDIVILHYPNPYATHYLLKYSNRKFKLFVYWHLDITKQKNLKKLFVNQNKRLITRADKIVGATPKHIYESEWTDYFGDKATILPYAIDQNRLAISVKEKEIATTIKQKYQGKIIFFFIGRHVPYKGISYLIEAAKNVKKNSQFIIAGTGELTEKLKNEAKEMENVCFVGKISDSEWRSYLWACDVFCFPSITRNEAFGLALAEGMYYGKPAVTFEIEGSGVNYVNLDRVTGIECPNGDIDAYATALNELVDNISERESYGMAAKQRILENFTFEKFEKNLLKLITENN